MFGKWHRQWTYGVLAGILLLGAVLGSRGLVQHVLWDDEANTALFAKNFLKSGELTAWDGTNLLAYQGGMELNSDLINVYIPPLQYYVAAVSFQLLGTTTLSARLPFLVFGLLTVIALFFLANRILLNPKLALLSCFLLVVNVQYLLFIRNCRYFSLGAFFTIALFAVMTTPSQSRKGGWIGHFLAVVCVVALFQTNYFNALSAVLMLPVFMLLFKKPKTWLVQRIGSAWLAAGFSALYVFLVRNPFGQRLAEGKPWPANYWANAYALFWVYFRDLGLFEMVALLLMPALVLPFVVPSLRKERDIAKKTLLVLIFVPITMVVVSLFSFQVSSIGNIIGYMRYFVPVIPLAALGSAVSLYILYQWARWTVAILLPVLVFSNVLYLGFLPIDNSNLPPKGLNCTLCRYVQESNEVYQTPVEKFLAQLATYKESLTIFVRPTFLSYPMMFYAPSHIFLGQLYPGATISAEKKKELPPHHFAEQRQTPDVVIISKKKPLQNADSQVIEGISYRKELSFSAVYLNPSRPEIPWHAFTEDEILRGRLGTTYMYKREAK